jgi:hypothetical protein
MVIINADILNSSFSCKGIKTYNLYLYIIVLYFSTARQPYMGLGLLVSSRFHDHTQTHHTR